LQCNIWPYDLRYEENAGSSHKNGIYCITLNVMEFDMDYVCENETAKSLLCMYTEFQIIVQVTYQLDFS